MRTRETPLESIFLNSQEFLVGCEIMTCTFILSLVRKHLYLKVLLMFTKIWLEAMQIQSYFISFSHNLWWLYKTKYTRNLDYYQKMAQLVLHVYGCSQVRCPRWKLRLSGQLPKWMPRCSLPLLLWARWGGVQSRGRCLIPDVLEGTSWWGPSSTSPVCG